MDKNLNVYAIINLKFYRLINFTIDDVPETLILWSFKKIIKPNILQSTIDNDTNNLILNS